jgi:hypothetical protein
MATKRSKNDLIPLTDRMKRPSCGRLQLVVDLHRGDLGAPAPGKKKKVSLGICHHYIVKESYNIKKLKKKKQKTKNKKQKTKKQRKRQE